jgi:hypothetical protein
MITLEPKQNLDGICGMEHVWEDCDLHSCISMRFEGPL